MKMNNTVRTKKPRGTARQKKSAPHGTGRSAAGSKKLPELDFTFLTIVIITVCVGMIMLLSSSTPDAMVHHNGDPYYFFKKQLVFAVGGFIAMLVISRIDYRRYKPLAGAMMLVCTVLLAMVFLPKIGVSHSGSRRWINLGFTELQPSELMKPVIGIFFAKLIDEKRYDLTKLKGMLPFFFWIGVVALLLLLETHLSGTIIICCIAAMVMLVGGASLKLFAGAGAVAIPAVILFAITDPVRSKRIFSFFDPFADKMNTGYQVVQGLYAIGSGGLFGLGLGQSVQKYTYVPEPYNDFIFSIICEELGLVGAGLIIALFMVMILRGVKIAVSAPDTFGTLTVTAIITQVAIQVIFNIGVVTASLPNTGVTLPFFSYGGTALLVLMAEMGVVLNISRYGKKHKNEQL